MLPSLQMAKNASIDCVWLPHPIIKGSGTSIERQSRSAPFPWPLRWRQVRTSLLSLVKSLCLLCPFVSLDTTREEFDGLVDLFFDFRRHVSNLFGCTVILTDKTLTAVKDNDVILRGHWIRPDGLWDIPLYPHTKCMDNVNLPPLHSGLYFPPHRRDQPPDTKIKDYIIDDPPSPTKNKKQRKNFKMN